MSVILVSWRREKRYNTRSHGQYSHIFWCCAEWISWKGTPTHSLQILRTITCCLHTWAHVHITQWVCTGGVHRISSEPSNLDIYVLTCTTPGAWITILLLSCFLWLSCVKSAIFWKKKWHCSTGVRTHSGVYGAAWYQCWSLSTTTTMVKPVSGVSIQLLFYAHIPNIS